VIYWILYGAWAVEVTGPAVASAWGAWRYRVEFRRSQRKLQAAWARRMRDRAVAIRMA